MMNLKYHFFSMSALNIVYPIMDNDENITNYVGSVGLNNLFTYNKNFTNFEYNYYEPFLKPDYLKTYSCKFHNIINSILGSDGLVLVYTRFITSGIVPFCLALEEHGFSRHKKSRTIPNLFNKEYSDSNIQSNSLSYGIICGNKYLSPNNKRELSFFTDDDNKDGKQMKVMIINEAGAEGLDFKNLTSSYY